MWLVACLLLAGGVVLLARRGTLSLPVGGRIPSTLVMASVVPLLAGAPLLRQRLADWTRLRQPESGGGKSTLLGVAFDDLSLEEAVARAESLLASECRGHIVVTPNSVSVLRGLRREDLLRVYRQADLVTPDGIGIVWASRILGVPLWERVCGIDLAESLLRRASVQGYGVFLLGGRQGVSARASRRLSERFPGLRIVGNHHGYFTDQDEPTRLIRQARPEILLVGMGVPRQELWMAREKDRLGVPLLVGVGGSLDVWSGDLRRAPWVCQRLGLEWLYRLLREPRRLKDALLIVAFIGRILALRAAIGAVGSPGRSAVSRATSRSRGRWPPPVQLPANRQIPRERRGRLPARSRRCRCVEPSGTR